MRMVPTNPHKPGPSCLGTHCYYHNVDEYIGVKRNSYYIVCFECNHVFQTEQELIDAVNKSLEEMAEQSVREGWEPFEFTPVTKGDDIRACPFCIHDL